MTGRTCHHCKQWVEPGEAHDCWTTTEEALTEDLSEDLREAWERVREVAAAEGEQRIYASHHCIMFARRTAYFFVRPKRSHLELCIFLDRTVEAPQIRRVTRVSAVRLAHIVQVRHRDEVEAPLTEWIAEAYALQDAAPPLRRETATVAVSSAKRPRPAKKTAALAPTPVERKGVARTAPTRRRAAAPRTRPRPKPK